jgi:glycosyltransferase involved in cell wall biosynthesis
MTILYLNHNFEGEGTYLRCYHIAKHVTESGFCSINLVTTSKTDRFAFRTKRINPDFTIITLPGLTERPSYLGYLVRGLLNCILTLSSRYSAVHSFAVAIPTTAVPGIFARHFRQKPVVIDWDDAWSGGYATYVSSFANRLSTFFEYKTPRLAHANAMTVCSEVLYRMAVEQIGMHPNQVYKVLNGANLDMVFPINQEKARQVVGIAPGDKVVMAMGRTFTKSFEILLDVFSRVQRANSTTRLVVVGELCDYGTLGSYIAGVKEKFFSLMSNIQFTGKVPYEMIKYYLSAADVLALPMEDSIHDYARFPIRLGDYLASGQPIVSNAVGELKRILLENQAGVVVGVNDLDGFAQGILMLLEDRHKGELYGTNAHRAAREQVSWELVAKDMIAVYKSLGIGRS